jgi:CRP/FNR family transcriptional regulator, cyclic AMP receptor protein
MNTLWYLHRCSLFECLNEDQLTTLSAMVRLEVVVKSDHVAYDDPGHEVIYLVKTGFMRILRLLDDGREVTIEVIGPGSLFGQIGKSIADSNTREIAEALGEATVCVFRRESFERTLRTWPDLYHNIAVYDRQRHEQLRERLIDLAFRSVPSRIASILLRYASAYGEHHSDGIILNSSMTQQDVADLIGASRQTVTTELNQWREQGIIDFDRSRYILKDITTLQSLI